MATEWPTIHMVDHPTVEELSTDTHPVSTTTTRGKPRPMPSQDMATLPVTTTQGHTLLVTLSTKAIQDTLALTNLCTGLEATTFTRGKLRLMLSQDMATTMATQLWLQFLHTAMEE